MRNAYPQVAVPKIIEATQPNCTPDEQKLIDTARDILIRQRNLSADEALAMLNEMADKRKTGIIDISSQLVSITKRLTI